MKCDFDLCENEGIYFLGYHHERIVQGEWVELGTPNYVEHRCEEHVLNMNGINHPSCGLPEVIFGPKGLRRDLVKKIKEIYNAKNKPLNLDGKYFVKELVL